VARPLLVVIGSILGLYFASMAATGIGLLLGDPYLSKPYTLTVTILMIFLAYVGFRVASNAFHTKGNAH
jgi:hypothetical protein